MQPSFYGQVSHEIKQPQRLKIKSKHNLNFKALKQHQSLGVDVNIYKMMNGLVGAAIANPLEKLLKKGVLKQQEFGVASKYMSDYEAAHISHHARPIYDGTPISSASNNFSKEKFISQHQLSAAARVDNIRRAVVAASQPRQIVGFKSFKDTKTNHRRVTRDKRLLEILESIFEKQISVRATEEQLGINHRIIEERVVEICIIMSEF